MARIDLGAKPYTYPQPVFIIAAYDEEGVPCAMNAAWCGVSDDFELGLCLSPFHKTVKNILKTGAFTVSMADAKHVKECDYFGIATGNEVKNKIEKAGMTVTKSEKVNAPIINELPICVECRLKSYDETNCNMRGEIVNVSVDENVFTGGKVDIRKVQPITFDPFNNTYHIIGEKVGEAWGSGKELENR